MTSMTRTGVKALGAPPALTVPARPPRAPLWPRAPRQPPGPSAPAPAMLQQGWSPALQRHCQGRSAHGPMSRPGLGPSPGRCLMPGLGLPLCPCLPAPGWGVGQALAARPCQAIPMGSHQGAADLGSALIVGSGRPSSHEFSSFSKKDSRGKNLSTEDVQTSDGK